MRIRELAVGTLVSAAAVGSCHAQQAAGMPVVQLQRSFTLSATAKAYYDSNIARASDAIAATRGLQKADTVFQPVLTAEVVEAMGEQALFLKGNAGYNFHRKNTQLDRANYDATGGYTRRVGMCQPMVYSTFTGGQSDLRDIEGTLVRNFQKTTSVAAGSECGRAIGPGVTVLVQHSDTKNSAEVRKTTDRTDRSLQSSVFYRNPVLGQLSLTYSYADTQFPYRIIPGRPVGDGFKLTAYGLSYSRNVGTRIQAQVSAARTMLKREFAPGGAPLKFNSTTYAGSLKYRVGPRLDLEADYSRDVKPSERIGKLYDVSKELQATAIYRVGTRYDLTLGEDIKDLNSNADTAPTSVAAITSSRTWDTTAEVRYHQTQRLSWVFSLEHERRKTNLPEFDYNSTRVGIAAEVGF